jgi:hypothetical protein
MPKIIIALFSTGRLRQKELLLNQISEGEGIAITYPGGIFENH